MQSISRRGLVISAAAAAAAFGLDGPLTIISPAEAQGGKHASGSPQALIDKGFVNFKVGDIEVTQIYDGTWEKAHDPNFIKGATVEETKALLLASGMTDAYASKVYNELYASKTGSIYEMD